jgi:outer membrane lipoprotein-sorting protein
MKSRIAAALTMVALCVAASAQKADEIVAKVIAARGGAEKAKSIQTRRITGHITMPQGGEAQLVSEWKRPGRMRMDFRLNDMTATRAVDGKTGWHLLPFEGDTTARPISGRELMTMQEDADMDGPFLDYPAKGNKVELLGKTDFQGKQAWDLKVLIADGSTQHYYVDPETALVIGIRKPNESGADVEGVISDYRDVQGLKFPFSNVVRQVGSDVSQTYKIDKIELNIPIEDARFQIPTAAQQQNPAAKP